MEKDKRFGRVIGINRRGDINGEESELRQAQ